MSKISNIIIETERLKIIPTSEQYAEEIFKEFTKEITALMFPKSPEKIEEVLDFIKIAEEKNEKEEDLTIVVLDKNSNEFLGGGGLHKINTDVPEFGIWIKKSAHGNKYGREAVAALKDWADKNISYKYLKYPADKRNVASKKIPEFLGGIIDVEYHRENAAGTLLEILEYRIYPK